MMHRSALLANNVPCMLIKLAKICERSFCHPIIVSSGCAAIPPLTFCKGQKEIKKEAVLQGRSPRMQHCWPEGTLQFTSATSLDVSFSKSGCAHRHGRPVAAPAITGCSSLPCRMQLCWLPAGYNSPPCQMHVHHAPVAACTVGNCRNNTVITVKPSPGTVTTTRCSTEPLQRHPTPW